MYCSFRDPTIETFLVSNVTYGIKENAVESDTYAYYFINKDEQYFEGGSLNSFSVAPAP